MDKNQYKVEWIPAVKPAGFDVKKYRNQLAAADYAITTCDFLIAQTGTIVFTGENHPSKALTLVPPSVIVISWLSSLVATLADFHRQIKTTGLDKRSSLIYFTGPSRTADIEKKLVLGVHGPRELTVFVIKD